MSEAEAIPEITIFNKPKDLEGLTPGLLVNLTDIAAKFGVASKTNPMRKEFEACFWDEDKEGQKESRLVLYRSVEPSNHDLVVSGFRSPEGQQMIPTSRGDVFWDRLLTVDEAQEAVTKIDQWAKEHNLIDEATGKRLSIPPDFTNGQAGPRISVDTFFTPQRHSYPLLGSEEAEALARFDRPEELTVRRHDGDALIVRKADEPMIQKRIIATLSMLGERGYDVSDPVAAMNQYLNDKARLELARREDAGEIIDDREKEMEALREQFKLESRDEVTRRIEGAKDYTDQLQDHNPQN